MSAFEVVEHLDDGSARQRYAGDSREHAQEIWNQVGRRGIFMERLPNGSWQRVRASNELGLAMQIDDLI